MSVMRRWTALAIAASLLSIAACGGDNTNQNCAPTDLSCSPPRVFDVVLESAPDNLGIVLISVETAKNANITILSPRGLPPAPSGSPHVRVILIGPTTASTVAQISFAEPPGVAPTVNVVSAAGNSAVDYRLLSSSDVRFRVRPSGG